MIECGLSRDVIDFILADVFKSLFQANPDIFIRMNEYLQFIGLITVDKPSIGTWIRSSLFYLFSFCSLPCCLCHSLYSLSQPLLSLLCSEKGSSSDGKLSS